MEIYNQTQQGPQAEPQKSQPPSSNYAPFSGDPRPEQTPSPPSPTHPLRPHAKGDAAQKVEQIVILTYFFIAAILLSRFVLSIFGANRQTLFVDFVYQITVPFMFPFENMFGGPVGTGNFRIEFEIIVALIVYALIFFGFSRLIKILAK